MNVASTQNCRNEESGESATARLSSGVRVPNFQPEVPPSAVAPVSIFTNKGRFVLPYPRDMANPPKLTPLHRCRRYRQGWPEWASTWPSTLLKTILDAHRSDHSKPLKTGLLKKWVLHATRHTDPHRHRVFSGYIDLGRIKTSEFHCQMVANFNTSPTTRKMANCILQMGGAVSRPRSGTDGLAVGELDPKTLTFLSFPGTRKMIQVKK
jgi:hypothetical protein